MSFYSEVLPVLRAKLLVHAVNAGEIEGYGNRFCFGCERDVDGSTCWCGDAVKGHGFDSGHGAVPMGCVCGYHNHQPQTVARVLAQLRGVVK